MSPSIPRPRNAMVLAAGLGLRLRPITDMIPKPLVPVAGHTMLDRVLDALDAVGVATCVVNTHYLGHMIATHLEHRMRPAIRVSLERELLDTGGGVAKVLPLLGAAPFYTVNADILWDEGPGAPALARLAEAFDDDAMDGLLLVVPLARAVGYDGKGDFNLDGEGRPIRRGVAPAADYVFTGVQLLHPRLFAGHPQGAFSLNRLYDRAIAEGRLRGLVHVGRWFHVGTVEGLRLAEAALEPPPHVPQ
jgi:MurNAc alpha-1-phosphate uridylyltransferase